MAAAAVSNSSSPVTQLRLAYPGGAVTRAIKQTPLRDASPSEIPVIDISRIFSSSLDDRKAVGKQVRDAAANTGFFYISHHGVPAATIESCRRAYVDFFRQGIDEKMKSDSNKSRFLNGYRGPKTQRLNPDEGVDVRESFSWRYDPHYDPEVKDVEGIPEEAKKHMSFDDWAWESTGHLPGFKQANIEYNAALTNVCRALTRTFALSLDLPEEFFDAKVQYPDVALAANYYPPIAAPKSPSPSDQVSIGSHTDFQFFTVLWQDGNGGLQVLSRDGQWLRAPPIEGTFVVNIADYLQRITNDVYVSNVHRVQNWSGRERLSMPFFWGFGLHESCGVLDGCVGEDGVRKYDEISCWEWIEARVAAMLEVGKQNGV